MASSNGTELRLTTAQQKSLAGPALSNSFTYDDRLFRSFDNFHQVSLRSDLDLRAMRQMLSEDGNPRKLEQVLTLPIRSANWELKGGSREAQALVAANLEPMLDTVIDQCTSAFAYRKAFFECVWKLDGAQVVYDRICLRPAVSCEANFHNVTGDEDGFRQRIAPMSMLDVAHAASALGWINIPVQKAFIYTYGAYREPITGVSDLDVSLACWENIQKLKFLWFQYLEQQSLPKVLLYGDDDGQSQRNAEMLAEANASAIIPIRRNGDPTAKMFDILESSGHGSDQFQKAILYLQSQQTQSVLASFTDLAQSASMSNAGSNALSADQSEFYLASCQAKADEMAEQITCGLVKPLVAYNLGPDAEWPELHFQPIGNRQTDRALALLEAIVTASKPNVPDQFTGFLINQVSTALGLDIDQVSDAVTQWGEDSQAQMQAAYAAQAAAAAQPQNLTPPPNQQPLTGTVEAEQAVPAPKVDGVPVRHPSKRDKRR